MQARPIKYIYLKNEKNYNKCIYQLFEINNIYLLNK